VKIVFECFAFWVVCKCYFFERRKQKGEGKSVIKQSLFFLCIGCFMIQLRMSSIFFQVYYYYPFSALSDSAKLYNDLRWNVTRPQGFEAVMRVRCSQVVFLVHLRFFLCKLLYS
jgi:hypothetical protein